MRLYYDYIKYKIDLVSKLVNHSSGFIATVNSVCMYAFE